MEGFWSQFLTVVLGSGFAVTITKVGFDIYDGWRKRTRNCKHLALQLAIYLEGYAINCANLAQDHSLAVDSGGHAGKLLGAVPEPGPLPVSDVYDLLDIKILDAVLDFPQRRQMAHQSAHFWWDVVGDDDAYRNTLEENTIKMALKAMQIARELRSTYKIDPRNMTFEGWDLEEHLEKEEKKLAEIEKQRKAEKLATEVDLAKQAKGAL